MNKSEILNAIGKMQAALSNPDIPECTKVLLRPALQNAKVKLRRVEQYTPVDNYSQTEVEIHEGTIYTAIYTTDLINITSFRQTAEGRIRIKNRVRELLAKGQSTWNLEEALIRDENELIQSND
jgi:hypothetical protein